MDNVSCKSWSNPKRCLQERAEIKKSAEYCSLGNIGIVWCMKRARQEITTHFHKEFPTILNDAVLKIYEKGPNRGPY